MNHRRSAWRLIPAVAVLLAGLAACGSDEPQPEPSPSPSERATVTMELGDRPFDLFVPDHYTPARPVALVVGLHGYTSHSAELASYFGILEHAQERGFLFAMPNGTEDQRRDQF